MQIELSIAVVLSGAIIAQGIFAAILLFFSKINRLSNQLLGALIAAISLWFGSQTSLDFFFGVSGVYQQDPDFYFLPIYFSFAFGPLIFLYTRSLTNSAFVFRQKDWIHFIPVILQFGLYLFLTIQSYEYRRWFWYEVHQPYTYKLEFYGTMVSMICYLIPSIKHLFRYQGWIKEHFSELTHIQLNWLRLILIAFLLFCGFWIIEGIMRFYFQLYGFSGLYILMGILTLILAAGGLYQTNLSNIQFKPSNPASPSPIEIDQKILNRIQAGMLREKYYLNPNLSLKEFSSALGYPPRVISFHVNKGLDQSFVDFVNFYRVEAVKEKLKGKAAENYTLLAIALEAGFNSKSTFNRIFKKFEGCSPTKFMDQIK